jgi:hypothetical protein
MLSQRMQKQERSPGTVVHNYREPSYKPQSEMQGDSIGEVG